MTYTPDTLLDFDGANQSIAEHALDYGIPASRIIMRLNAGWSVENAITRPIIVNAITRLTVRTVVPSSERAPPEHQLYSFNGETLTIPEWSERTGIKAGTIRYRLRAGIPFARAITTTKTPLGPRSRQRLHEDSA